MSQENSESDMSSNIDLRQYRDSDWPQLKSFTAATWRYDHPLLNKALFDWQFRGFGNSDQGLESLILFHNGQVIGFRGVIPGLYQIARQNRGMKILPGGSLAQWMLDENYRGQKLGLLMHQRVMQTLDVLCGAGSNTQTSVPFYLKSGFSVMESVNRYVVPLCAEGYQSLSSQTIPLSDVQAWVDALELDQVTEAVPVEADPRVLAEVWEKMTFPLQITSLYRNADFWQWRYIDSPVYEYIFFGNAMSEGVIVGRIQKIYTENHEELTESRVFRFIEFIPDNPCAWNWQRDIRFSALIHGVLAWALKHGCVAADFYCSSSRFEPTLEWAGFKKWSETDAICSLASLFEPIEYQGKPFNALWNVVAENTPINFDDTYVVKSDNDMDRPNILAQEPI